MREQAPSTPKTHSTTRLALWLTFIAFLLIVTVFHSKIAEIRLGSEGVSAKMASAQDVAKLAPDDRKAAQDELSQRVNTLEQEARTHANSSVLSRVPSQSPAPDEPDTAPVSPATYRPPQELQPAYSAQQASLPNIAGAWMSPTGLAYQVTQYGNYVLISEMAYGVVDAAAAGQIQGWSFSLPAETVARTTGVLSLTVSPDQRQMTGQYRDNMTGAVQAMYLNR